MKKYPSFILAGALSSSLHAAMVQIPLNYNFNGIAHAGETGAADSPSGFRSISDRALDFSAGVPNDALLNKYAVVTTAGSLDVVHLGNRNTVDGGGFAFEGAADGDNFGIRPTWLATDAEVDQSGPQTTMLASALLLDVAGSASFIYQISNGGGDFDVVFGFTDSTTFTATLTGSDWFVGGTDPGGIPGGFLPGTDSVDSASASGNRLRVEEMTVDLSAQAGKSLNSLTFQNRSNTSAGYAILGANVVAVPEPGITLLSGLAALGLLGCRRRA